MEQYIVPAVVAFGLTLTLTLLALRFFPKLGLMDRPWKYGLNRKPIPYYGGLVLYVGFVTTVLIFMKLDTTLLGVLLGATLIAGVSFLDDMFGLSPWLRLGIQVLAALILVFSGIGITSISNPIGDPIVLDAFKIQISLGQVYTIAVLSALFTILWVVAIVNTMNWLDGLNGLPSGVTTIAALTLFFLSIRSDLHYDMLSQMPVAMMSIILFACAFAFWFFDFHPAKILMGDTGSMFIGFILATLAIFSGGKIATAFLVLGIPILDAIWVILRRIIQKKSPLKGDLKHLHHRLLEIGLTERKALSFLYILSAAFGAIAILLVGIQKLYAIIALGLFMVIIAVLAVRLQNKKKKSS